LLAVTVIIFLFGSLMMSELLFDFLEDTLYGDMPFIFDFIDIAGPLVVTFIFIVFFYLLFLPVKLKVSQLCIAAGITSILWTIIRAIFSEFINYNQSLGFAFGSLKAVFILVLWSYFSFAVLIFGMEILANIRKRDSLILQGLFDVKITKSSARHRLLEKFIREYHEDEIVFNEGDQGERMFYVVSGLINIVKNGTLINVVKPTEYFGEMAMLLNAPRIATAVVAVPGTQLAIISRSNFETILHDNPEIVITILKSMATRLRKADEHFCATN
jgi:membrane protein